MTSSSQLKVIEIDTAGEPKTAQALLEGTDTLISFFVPCFNEEENVIGSLEKIVRVATQEKLAYEILVFDDYSRDGTVEVVKRFMEAHPEVPLCLFINRVNRGVARNFFEGAFHASGRYYRLICGDDVEPIESHLALVHRIGQADIIIPYYTKIDGRKLHRHILSHAYTFLVNLASGRHLHYYNGCPIYRRFDVIRFHIETTGLGYQAEFLTRLLHEGRTYVEVSLVSIDRKGSVSLTLRNFFSVVHSLFKIALRRIRVLVFK